MNINDVDLDSDKPTGNKNNNFRNVFIGAVILILLSIIFYSAEVKEKLRETENVKTFEEEQKELEELKEIQDLECKNIEVVDSFKTIGNAFGLVLKNNNENEVNEILIEVIFYDENRKPIEIISGREEILYPNENTYLTISNMPTKFEEYDVLISKDFYKKRFISRRDDVSIKEVAEDKYSKKIEVKNNSKSDIDKIELIQLFYNENDRIISMKNINTYNLKGNKTEIETAYKDLYSSKGNEKIDYDRMEIILKAAYDNNY